MSAIELELPENINEVYVYERNTHFSFIRKQDNAQYKITPISKVWCKTISQAIDKYKLANIDSDYKIIIK